VVGFGIAKKEGVEFKIFGVNFRINFKKPFIHLPGME